MPRRLALLAALVAVTVVAVTAVAVTAVAVTAVAQNTEPPAFEAASIKVFEGPDHSGEIAPAPAGMNAHNVTVTFLIQWAWNLQPYEISMPKGLQESVDATYYDIVARAGGPVSLDRLKLMTQSMLIERFHLTFHKEKREIPVFALLVAKDGPRELHIPASPNDPPHEDFDSTFEGDGRRWIFHNEPVGAVGGLISNGLERPIVDMTGITGKFDYTFVISKWTRADGPLGDHVIANDFPELTRQLGLRISAQNAPAEVTIIDHLDKTATAN